MTVTINAIGAQVSGVSFTVSGTTSYTPNLEYRDDSGAYVGLPSGSTIGSPSASWKFTHPGLAAGTHTVTVEELVTNTLAVSNSFSVGNPHHITPNAPSGSVAGHSVAFTGTVSGYTRCRPLPMRSTAAHPTR